jgi:hypothetical protein
MQKKLFLKFGLTFLLFLPGFVSFGMSAPDRASVKESVPSSLESVKSREIVRPGSLDSVGQVSGALPRKGVLVALIRWGLTTLGIFDASSRTLFPLATRETGELVVSQAADRLAYLVREGPNPARNYIEILNLQQREILVVQPASDYAILGFVLNSTGQQLSYAAVNLRTSRSTRMTWRTGVADLEEHETRLSLSSVPHKAPVEGIPVPFAWPIGGQVYFQGLLPFRGMVRQGIWTVKPDGAALQNVLPEPAYTGIPRLSPDGSRLAYLATDMESLPKEYLAAPGTPPGNVLAVMTLATGEKSEWTRKTGAALGVYAWSATGEEILAVQQAWLEGRFRDVEILRIRENRPVSIRKIDQSQSFKNVTAILECRGGSLFWVEKDRASAKLYARTNQVSDILLDLPGGEIQVLGCLDR